MSSKAAALFLGVVAGARALSFPLPGGSEVSFDTAIFDRRRRLSRAVALTSVGVAWVLAVDGMRRARLPYALHFGGVAGALLAGWSRAFGVGSGRLRRVAGAGARRRVPVSRTTGLQALQEWLGGLPPGQALRRNAQSVVAEAMLLPLASAIVLIWEPHRPIPFSRSSAAPTSSSTTASSGWPSLLSDLRLRV